jgi:type I restriction enzyme M protein
MHHAAHHRLVSFIWSIADDCLRDVYVRGKYRDVILPMVVLRRLDVLLEPTKEAVLEEVRFQREELDFAELEADNLRRASGQVFYNVSPWTLQRLHDTATNSRQILEANFMAYLDGFSANVREITDKFKLRSQIRHMAAKDVLLDVLEKFTDPRINLTPHDQRDPDGRTLPGLSNLGMGYVFEELIRKFNEENNEEAGEHFTPREVIDLMTHLVFAPLRDRLPPVITVYDPACGSGGMLTESQDFIKDPEGKIRATGDVYLFGKEINDETYAICKSDMMIKGNDPENIRVGSTLSTDEFAGKTFDFMLSNPPYGKSWSSEQKHIKDGRDVIDPRFRVRLQDYWGEWHTEDATPRSSDGQLLFLMEMVSKMKDPAQNGIGSRIASVHNGSSLFTGDAGGGESNIRRYLIENDLLEAIIQLPNNLFYNTGITTYIWLLNNNKGAAGRGCQVKLVDASECYQKLRKNLGAKNCELTGEHIRRIREVVTPSAGPWERSDLGSSAGGVEEGSVPYLTHSADGRSAKAQPPADEYPRVKVFDNDDFGYYKITVERPERLRAQLTAARIAELRFDRYLRQPMEYAWETYGERVYTDLKAIGKELLAWCEQQDLNLSTKNRKKLTSPRVWRDNRELLHVATLLLDELGDEVYLDFNRFTKTVDRLLKDRKIKLRATQKKAIYAAVTDYDPEAERVIKKDVKLKPEKLKALLDYHDCTVEELPLYGYFPVSPDSLTPNPGYAFGAPSPNTAGERGAALKFRMYESSTELRDTESVPLKENVRDYFLREVAPHVPEAWIDLSKTKVGYEISFNKYFYRHTPLRSLEEVSAEIRELERESEGLISEILNMGVDVAV